MINEPFDFTERAREEGSEKVKEGKAKVEVKLKVASESVRERERGTRKLIIII